MAETSIKYGCIINRRLMYISKHSVPIIALHFLYFKIVNAIAVAVYGMDGFMIAAFPVLMIMSSVWWILLLMLIHLWY